MVANLFGTLVFLGIGGNGIRGTFPLKPPVRIGPLPFKGGGR